MGCGQCTYARSFYIYLMNMHACGKLNGYNDLVYRIRNMCDKHNVSFFKYVFNKNYASHVRQNILRISQDCLSDSVRPLKGAFHGTCFDT